MKKIIVLGSLNMDLTIKSDCIPAKGETINGYDFFINSGGKGGNQAVACAKLGAPTKIIACVGNDSFGDNLVNNLSEYGVDINAIKTSKKSSTGVAMILRCEGDNRIIISHGANYDVDFDYVKKTIDANANFQDIFLTQLENDYDVVKDSLKYAKEKGMFTVFNPAPARKIDLELYKYIDLLILNESECEVLTNVNPIDSKSYIDALTKFKKLGTNAIITLGSQGSVVLVDDELVLIHPYDAGEVIDTTGAGDTYIGAICDCLIQGQNLVESMKYASIASALAVTKKGAQISIPNKKDVESFNKRRNLL